MNALTQNAEAFPGSALEMLRLHGEESFQSLGLPSKKQESWRFTPLNRLGDLDAPLPQTGSPRLEGLLIPEAHRLVFSNGRLNERLSNIEALPSGCRISSILEIAQDPEAEEIIGDLLPPQTGAFQALNSARFDHGALIVLEAGTRLEGPIHLIHHCDTEEAALYPRNLIMLKARAEATIIEHFVSTGPMIRMPLAELHLGAGADLHFLRLQDEADKARHLGFVAIALERDSKAEFLSLALGADLFRLELETTLRSRGAEASLSGLHLGRGAAHGEHLVRVEHQAPDCSSHQLFRSILSDSSRGVFTGRIVVAPGAQGTDANQSSKSLLLSDRAVAFNNPQLEIDADDVRCTHGSTVGELDEEALFYLRARGIGKEEARALLMLAFAGEVLQSIGVEDLKTRLEERLIRRFHGATAR